MKFAVCQACLGLCNITPVDEWLDGIRNGRLVEVLGVESGDLADVAIVQFIKASSFDDGDGYRGIFGQTLGNS